MVCRALRKNVFGTGIRIGRAQILRTGENVRAYITKLGEIELHLERQRELVRLRYEVHLIEDGDTFIDPRSEDFKKDLLVLSDMALQTAEDDAWKGLANSSLNQTLNIVGQIATNILTGNPLLVPHSASHKFLSNKTPFTVSE